MASSSSHYFFLEFWYNLNFEPLVLGCLQGCLQAFQGATIVPWYNRLVTKGATRWRVMKLQPLQLEWSCPGGVEVLTFQSG